MGIVVSHTVAAGVQYIRNGPLNGKECSKLEKEMCLNGSIDSSGMDDGMYSQETTGHHLFVQSQCAETTVVIDVSTFSEIGV